MRSVTSTHSDTVFEKVNRQARKAMSPSELQMKQQSASLHSAINLDNGAPADRRSRGVLFEISMIHLNKSIMLI